MRRTLIVVAGLSLCVLSVGPAWQTTIGIVLHCNCGYAHPAEISEAIAKAVAEP
jgi:hypothetical protein